MVASQQVVEAVAGLQPRSRALLELAPRRGMSDADIAALLGVTTAEVQRLREQAALELAAALQLNPDKLDVLEQELRRLDEADWERRAVPRRRPRIAVAGAVLLVLAGITAAVVPRENHDRLVAATTTIGPRSGPAVGFQRLNGTYGHGSVRLIRDPARAHLRLRVADFPRPQGGGYTVWLYSSPADAHRLAFTTFADFHGTLGLPRDFAKYRFVDISRQVTDDRAHSGPSLLRAPLAELR